MSLMPSSPELRLKRCTLALQPREFSEALRLVRAARPFRPGTCLFGRAELVPHSSQMSERVAASHPELDPR